LATKKTAKVAPKKTVAKKATAAKKAPAAKQVKKNDTLACAVCGLVVRVDEVCGCVEVCDVICCGKEMKRKK
jgi:hypothetical protein